MLAELRQLLERDKRTDYAKANASGLAPSTLAHIERGETRRPQGVTMQMAYAMLGYKLVAVPK